MKGWPLTGGLCLQCNWLRFVLGRQGSPYERQSAYSPTHCLPYFTNTKFQIVYTCGPFLATYKTFIQLPMRTSGYPFPKTYPEIFLNIISRKEIKFFIHCTAYQRDMQTVCFLNTFDEYKIRFGRDYTLITETDIRFTNMKF